MQNGEARKDKEYPCRAGLAVTGVAVDVYGRHGPALQDLLQMLADLARQHDIDRCCQPRRWLHRWRVRIATEIARGCARQISKANSSTAPLRAAPQLQYPEGREVAAPPSPSEQSGGRDQLVGPNDKGVADAHMQLGSGDACTHGVACSHVQKAATSTHALTATLTTTTTLKPAEQMD